MKRKIIKIKSDAEIRREIVKEDMKQFELKLVKCKTEEDVDKLLEDELYN